MSRRLIVPVFTSVVSLFVSIGLALVLPAVMLSRWGNAGYSLVIAVQGFALYVSVADLGVQAFVTRQLAVLVARGDMREASALAVTAFKTLAMLAMAGCAMVATGFVVFGGSVRGVVALRAGVSGHAMSLAFVAQTFSTGAGVALSGWSTSVESATGRYQRVQAVGLIRNCASSLSFVAMAYAGASPTASLIAQALILTAFDATRIVFARQLLPPSGTALEALSPLRFLVAARGSLFLAFGAATQNGLQPAVMAVLSENAAAAAIPARTLANGARTVAMAVSNVLWVPLAARLTRDAKPADSFLMWKRASPVLSTLVLAGVALLLVLAPLVVPLWLPRQSATILSVLPLFAAEQAAFLAAFPSLMLLQALGKFGTIGAVTLTMAFASLVLTYWLVPRTGAAGFGMAGLVGTSCVYAPALLLSEYVHWRASGARALSTILHRAGLAFAAVAACLAHRRFPVLSVTILFGLTAAALAYSRPWQLPSPTPPAA
ncbi:MAG: hypothetical protein M3O50_15055 [Myxococcota bacterium]|nr:hypothetical protein [Myxococcota bacterium]